MCPQIACPRRCKVTLVAFVSLFPTDDNIYCDDEKNFLYIHKPKQLWKLSKLITNGTDKGNIARIANALQCPVSDNKDCHEFRFSIVRIVNNFSNVKSPGIVQKPENLPKI